MFNFDTALGRYISWQKTIDEWEQTYCEIRDFTFPRFREEIAFTIAASKQKINIVPSTAKFQSSYYLFDAGCALFHYGGEFMESKRIKRCLKHFNMLKCLLELSKVACNDKESWLINKMIGVVKTLD